MKLDIKGVNLDLTDAITDHAQRRMSAALDQHASHVEHAEVRLKDLNGPKGGVDMQCEVLVKLATGDHIVVKKTETDLYSVVSHAADTLKVTVKRKLDKVKQHHPH